MTLIVGFISNPYVALLTDRRITWQIGGANASYEDTENKAILLAGHFLMGYTGFARLGGVQTDRWVGELLAPVANHSDYFATVMNAIPGAVQAMRQPLSRSGHAFLSVGYAIDESSPQTEPKQVEALGVTITNAAGGSYGAWTPRPNFDIYRTPPLRGPDDAQLVMYGRVPNASEKAAAIDLIQRYRKRDPSRSLGVVQILVDMMRKVAARDQGVSSDISASVLPREAVGQGFIDIPLKGVRDPLTTAECMFLPAGKNVDQADAYGPTIVNPGEPLIMGIQLNWGDRPLPPPKRPRGTTR